MRKLLKSEWLLMSAFCFLFTATMVLLNSCGGGGGGGSTSNSPTNSSSSSGGSVIGTQGGTVTVSSPSSPIAGTKVVIPAGALSSDVTITISAVTNPPAFSSTTSNTIPNNKVVNFGPDGTQFSQPVSITLPYDPTLVSNKNNLRVYTYNAQDDYWEEEQLESNDTTNNLITATVSHFSLRTAQEQPLRAYNFTYYKASDGNIAATVTLKVPFDQFGGYIPLSTPERIQSGENYAHDLLFHNLGAISFKYSVTLMEKGLIGFLDRPLETQYIKYDTNQASSLPVYVEVSKTGNANWFSSGFPYADVFYQSDLVNWYSGYATAFKFSHPPELGKEYYAKVTLSVIDVRNQTTTYGESDRDNATSPSTALATIDSDEDGILNAYDAISTYSISGTVTLGGVGLSGVTLTAPGAGAGSATTDSSGNYTITGVANGSYTVTPSKSGYTFAPTSTSVTVSGANQTGKNFTAAATVSTYSISGTVTASSVGLSGVTMTLSGAGSGSATTDSSGNYTITGVANGSYTVTPSKSGYTFAPTSTSVAVSGANQSGKNFTATATVSTYSISGTVTSSSVGLSGVTMTLSGAGSGSATTDSSGNYTITGVANGSYTVTPSKSGYTFAPTSTSVAVSGANQSGKNFTATATVATYSISGMVTSSSAGLTGVTITLSGAGSGSATTDSSGDYTITGVANGSYTVTPSRSGYTFSPASTSVTVSGANQTGENFTATATSVGGGTWTLLKLPDTGQTTCYDAAGTVIACAGTGQDGAYTLNPPSYTDNGNGTITDNVTGLIWQKQDDATTRTWDAAGTYCSSNSAALSGTGWRLPSLMELASIVDSSRTDPAINTTYFLGMQSSYYWSSNTYANFADRAWCVDFYDGYENLYMKTASYYVRCVRSGP